MPSKVRKAKNTLAGISVKWLTEKCNEPQSFLWKCARKTEEIYQEPRKQKKEGGGSRDIEPPKPRYKPLLKRISKLLTRKIYYHPAAHGGVPGRSSFTSARLHLGKKFILTRDIKNCYPSVTKKALKRSFLRLGSSVEFAEFLSSISTIRDHIPQGGHLSSLVLNLYFVGMDDHLFRRSKSVGDKYGRLSDDFVASGNTLKSLISIGNEIDYLLVSRGLEINDHKRSKKGLMDGRSQKLIHSLNVNSKRGIRPASKHINIALEKTQLYTRRCCCSTPEDLPCLAALRSVVVGYMYYFRQADRSPARHIQRMVEAADQKVLRMLHNKNLQIYKNKWWLISKSRNEPGRLCNLWLSQNRSSLTG